MVSAAFTRTRTATLWVRMPYGGTSGAVAFSVALTTVSTLLSPLLTPALVKLFGAYYSISLSVP